jgi:hypothetical protein
VSIIIVPALLMDKLLREIMHLDREERACDSIAASLDSWMQIISAFDIKSFKAL